MGVKKNEIPTIILNLCMRERFNELLKIENDNEFIDEINKNKEELLKSISIEQTEEFLGFLDVEGTNIKLKDYQQRASDNNDRIFKTKKFAVDIMPTGSGKSYVALTEMLKEKYGIREKDSKGILYLAPSKEILDQIQTDLIENVLGLKIKNDVVLEKGSLGRKRSTEQVLKEAFPNLEFSTYASLKSKSLKKYGLIITDELHRTGADEWGKYFEILIKYQDEDVRVLGLTATPIRDADAKNMADEVAKLMGYTQEEIENEEHFAMNMSLIEAIRNGIIVNPFLVSCEYTLMQIEKYKKLYSNINEIEDNDLKIEKLNELERILKENNLSLDDLANNSEYSVANLARTDGVDEILKSNLKSSRKIYCIFTNS